MQEEHLVPFLQQWNGINFGLMVEQGAESIHKALNSLMYCFINIPNRVECLRCILRGHYLCCCLANRDAKPQPRWWRNVGEWLQPHSYLSHRFCMNFISTPFSRGPNLPSQLFNNTFIQHTSLSLNQKATSQLCWHIGLDQYFTLLVQ